jgi:hypothetical protein
VSDGAGAGYGYRSERRTTRREARRRKAIRRLYLTAGPVVVLILVVVALVVFLGGPKRESTAETTLSTAVPAEPVARSALLVIEQEETVPALVLLLPQDQAGTALGLPGTMLIKTATGFKTLAELHGARQDEALTSALTEVLGASVGTVASVQWEKLVAALSQTGSAGSPSAEIGATEEDVAMAAGAVMTFAAGSGSSNGATAWDQIELGGDASGFRDSVAAMAPSISAGSWTQAVLPGKLVEGVGFTYFEPDVEQVKALLAGRP